MTVLPTLGGRFANAGGLNDGGAIVGEATLPGEPIFSPRGLDHAFLWQRGAITDLGTLGGPNSYVQPDYPVNDSGMVAGYSQTSTPDPNREDICDLIQGRPIYLPLTCLPFVWQHGVMRALPTLGGNNGFATEINNRGDVVGQAETTVPAPACAPFIPFVYEAAIWQHGQIGALPPFAGDMFSGANGINDEGQVVGSSGGCPGAPGAAPHAMLWQDGKPIDLGTLGGADGNIAFDINDRGQVIGQSDLPGDTVHHGFLWQNGRMRDLGTLPGLPESLANGISNQGQIVGFSDDETGSNAVPWIWQGGVMTDLNTLIPGDSPILLVEALGINDRGQITGFGDLSDGEQRVYLLTPCKTTQPQDGGCGGSVTPAASHRGVTGKPTA